MTTKLCLEPTEQPLLWAPQGDEEQEGGERKDCQETHRRSVLASNKCGQ